MECWETTFFYETIDGPFKRMLLVAIESLRNYIVFFITKPY